MFFPCVLEKSMKYGCGLSQDLVNLILTLLFVYPNSSPGANSFRGRIGETGSGARWEGNKSPTAPHQWDLPSALTPQG